MKKITAEELANILIAHEKWLEDFSNGKRADLRSVDLSNADLHGANLQDANLCDANLRGANLNYADLNGADLCNVDLRGANLCDANLRGANLNYADLNGADLCDANLDYTCWPLWYGSLSAQIDDRIAVQLLYHLLSAVESSSNVSPKIKDALFATSLVEIANQFHHVNAECKKIKEVNL